MTTFYEAATKVLETDGILVKSIGDEHTVFVLDGTPDGTEIPPELKAQIEALFSSDEYKNPPKYKTAEAAKTAVIDWIEEFTSAVTGPVPFDERVSWTAKEAAARAYISGSADVAHVSMIEGEASVTGEDPAGLAAIIIAKADAFRGIVAKVAGLRRKTMAAIDAVEKPSDYETVLDSARAEAANLAAGLNIPVAD